MGHTRRKPAEGRKLFMLNRFFLYAGQAVEGFIELSVKPLYFLIFFRRFCESSPSGKGKKGVDDPVRLLGRKRCQAEPGDSTHYCFQAEDKKIFFP